MGEILGTGGNRGKSWRRRRQRGKLAPKAPVNKGEREGRRGKEGGKRGKEEEKRGSQREEGEISERFPGRGKFLSAVARGKFFVLNKKKLCP